MFGIRSLPRTLEAALRDMRHAKNVTRLSALGDLVRLSQTSDRARALSALCEVMDSDAELHVRAAAALALGDADAKEARSALLEAARTGPVQVREMALAALGEIADAADQEVRTLLSAARQDAALRDEVPSVRLAAAILLARVGDKCGADVIRAVVERKDRVASLEDEQAALELAGELEISEARPALARRAFGFFGLFRDPLAWHARVALARLGDEQAKAAILRGLSAFTRDARTIAVAAAGRARLREARAILQRMVRRDATEGLNPQGESRVVARCVSPTGESPVPVSVGAPGSRPQASKGDLRVQAGRQKPVKRRKPYSGEQARGPQH